MKKILFTTTIVLLFFATTYSQVPDWSVNASNFSYNMTITGTLNIDQIETTDENDIIAAFDGDECRGLINPEYKESVDRYICYLMVYSNSPTYSITFKIYDASEDEVRDVETTMEFEVNGIVGQIDKPYIWSDPTLSNESLILSYNIDNQQIETVIDEYDIFLEMPWGDDLTSLIANFTTSEYAYVRLDNPDGELQESGITSNDFSDTIHYWVLSADETDTSWYNIVVKWGNQAPTWITLSDTIIDEAYQEGSLIGNFTSDDVNEADVHTYTLVEGEGDTDNYRFIIEGTELYLNQNVNFYVDSVFSVRIESNDGKSGVFERNITIKTVFIYKNDLTVRANNIISPNGDNIFDTWKIENSILYDNCEFFIMNSNGEIVFQSMGYTTEWDGTSNGKNLPIGAYYYIIKTSQEQILRGSITLIK